MKTLNFFFMLTTILTFASKHCDTPISSYDKFKKNLSKQFASANMLKFVSKDYYIEHYNMPIPNDAEWKKSLSKKLVEKLNRLNDIQSADSNKYVCDKYGLICVEDDSRILRLNDNHLSKIFNDIYVLNAYNAFKKRKLIKHVGYYTDHGYEYVTVNLKSDLGKIPTNMLLKAYEKQKIKNLINY